MRRRGRGPGGGVSRSRSSESGPVAGTGCPRTRGGRSVAGVHPAIQPDRRVLVLSADARTPAEVASLLCARGYGDSGMTVLSQLGGPAERIVAAKAADWASRSTTPAAAQGMDAGPN